MTPEGARAPPSFANALRMVEADPAMGAVMGESAGGNLATVVCLKARDEGGAMPVRQVLVSPMTTVAPMGEGMSSIMRFADAEPPKATMLDWFESHSLPNAADAENAYASLTPTLTLALDHMGLPPASIILADVDPLFSQGTAYAEVLTAAGVETTVLVDTGVSHELFGMHTVVDKAMEAEMAVVEALTSAFA